MANKKYSKEIEAKIPHLTSYIGKYSPESRSARKNKIITLCIYLRDNFEINILDAQYDHLEQFFKRFIDSREIQRNSKKAWFYAINSYYNTIIKIEKKRGNEIKNPMPDLEILSFEENELSIDEQIEALMDDESVFQMKDALKILEHYFYNEETLMMLQICLQLFSHGARIDEILSAEISRINLEERFFVNFVKSKKHRRLGLFFFPDWVTFHLQNWINQLEAEYNKIPKYLFPSPYLGPDKHITKAIIEQNMKKIGEILNIKAKCNPHAWRNLINETRESAGITPTRRMLLLNQTAPGGVNSANYLKSLKLIRKLRKIYDKSTPIIEPDFLRKYRINSQM